MKGQWVVKYLEAILNFYFTSNFDAFFSESIVTISPGSIYCVFPISVMVFELSLIEVILVEEEALVGLL